VLDALVSVADRLIELLKYREERRAKLFDDLVEPVMNQLTEIHADYLRILETLRQKLAGVTEETSAATVRDATEYLLEARIDKEPLRRKLIALVQQLAIARREEPLIAFARACVQYLESGQGVPGTLGTMLLHEFTAGDPVTTAQRIQTDILPSVTDNSRQKWEDVTQAFAAARLDAAAR